MADITATRSSELMVTQLQGDTEAGEEFVDRVYHTDMLVVDAGRVIMPDAAAAEAIAQARAEGLTVDEEVTVP